MEQRVIDLALSVSADGRAGARRASLGASSTLEGDFGLGSLERAELRVRLEDAFGCRLPDQPFMAARSIGDLVALIQGAGRGDAVPLAAAVAPQVRALSHAGQARTLLEALALNAEATPEARAISFLKEGREEQTVTFRGLFEAVRRVAGGLQIQPGDRVGLMLPTGLGFVAAFFGTMAAGGVPVPMYPPVRPDQIQAFVERQSGILANAGARILVTFPAVTKVAPWLRARVPELREVAVVDDLLTASPVGTLPEPRTDDFAFIQYTSGSTGTPRGVVLSHANLLANIRAFGEVLPLQPDDVLVSWLPLYHDMGLIGMLLTPLFHGLPLVLMGPEDFLMRPSRWLRAFHEYGGSVTAAPNFAYELCARKVPDAEIVGLNLARWRVAINGAEPVRVDTLERFFERYQPFGFRPSSMRPAYGLAEATLCVSMAPIRERPRVDRVSRESLDREGFASPTDDGGVAFVSAGRAVPGVEVRVVDGHGQVLKARWQGQLHFRGTSAFGGYFNNGAATADVAREDGWMDSGDFAYLADGEVFPTGRRKALILVGGRNLHAEDVEKAAGDVPGIRAGCAAAFGVADEAAGTERMVVVAESRLRGEAERLMEAVRQRVTEAVGVPPDTVVIAPPGSVPKTPSGKVRRSACRDAWQAGTLGHKRGMVRQLLGMMRERPGYWLGQAPRLLYAGWVWGCVGSAVLAIEGASFLGMAPAAAPRLSRWLLRAIGVRVRVQGALPTERPLLLVANHGSAMDPIVLMAALPTQLRFVAAEWVAQHPVVRPVLAALGGVAVRRGGEAQEPIARMQEALSQGACLVAFAEGGLERTPGLRPFMRGPFVAAARAGAALVPVALNGTRRGLQWGEWVPHRGEIVVTIGEAVAPPSDRFEAVTEVARQIRDRIAADCGEPLVQRRLVRED